MQALTLALVLGSLQQALAAPIVVTRSHTADAVTVTDTYTTLTNTHTAPTVEILVSDAPAAAATEIATLSTTTSSQASTTSSATSTAASGALTARPTAIVYSPYNSDSTCKDFDTVKSDLKLISSTGISKIRVYGTDCNSINTVLPNAASFGLTVNQGFWISGDGADSIDDAVDAIISYGSKNGWGVFDFITVGNEAVQAGYVSVSELISKISSVRNKFEAAGYSGKFTTSEPPVIFEKNPTLCTADVDFIGVNPHAYFDTYSSAATAGTFVKGQVEIVKKYCPDIDIMVTETGYPSAGIQNGGNIPSKANQKIAIAAILSEMDNDVTILSTFNDYWKDPGAYGIEQSFGVIDLFE
ncbi:putative beta-glucosidase btgE [Cyberlindnera fabianii]|uniref:Putative beta-glucosidase btgE n=1 Tax=Cyberlindnera fabianii TaxID=36022 RepID=A0A1V2LEE4_CYBFA|nr:putative beta-glucosidase btgE [Cyberlindnera fabianii]